MFQKIEPVIRKSIPCPNCGNLFGVDHLNQGQYTWLCNNCDHYFTLKHDGNEYFTKVDSKKEMTTLILKLRQNLPLYFVYPCFKDKDDDYRYHLYNSCPINFIRYTEDVIIGNHLDVDYHGAFDLICVDDRKYKRENIYQVVDQLRAKLLVST